MKFKAELIIFDLDGTLMNSIPDLTISLNHTATKFGFESFSEDQLAAMVGGGVRKLVEDAFNCKMHDEKYKDYFDEFMVYYSENHSVRSHLFEGVEEVLQHFKHKKMAILSNKFENFTREMADNYGISKYLDFVHGANNYFAKKPSAEGINYILNEAEAKREETIMVGDSQADIRTAKNAGVASIAVTYGYRSREELTIEKPDFICDSIDELKEILI